MEGGMLRKGERNVRKRRSRIGEMIARSFWFVMSDGLR